MTAAITAAATIINIRTGASHCKGADMRLVLLRDMIESLLVPEGQRNASGKISALDDFLNSSTLALLDRNHDGIYSLVVFHPRIDTNVTRYLEAGSLSSDAGMRVLALFFVDAGARWPAQRKLAFRLSAIEVQDDITPAYEFVRASIAKRPLPSFPGVLFFERMATSTEPIYASLAATSTPLDVRNAFVRLFSLAEAALLHSRSSTASFADSLATQLARENVAYARSGPTSVPERLHQALHVLRPLGKELATIATTIGGKVIGK